MVAILALDRALSYQVTKMRTVCHAVLHTDTRGVGSNAVEAGGIDVEQLGVRVSGVAGVSM